MRTNPWPAMLLLAILGTISAPSYGADDGPAFLTACGDLSADGTSMTVAGEDGWLFLRNELRHLSVGPFWGDAAAKVSRARKASYADPLAAILDYQAQCDALGIQLILVPVPPKAVIYPDAISDAEPGRYDVHHQAFYALLREKGVTVLDLTAPFLAERAAGKPATYCKQDSHWSGHGCVVAASHIAAAVKTQDWAADLATHDYATEPVTLQMTGDLVRDMEPAPPAEPIALRRVASSDDHPTMAETSPVLLLGDSHTLVFHAGGDMHSTGAGLADQLAHELGIPIDVLGVRGSGARPARVALYKRAKAPGYIATKKVIIWCFAAREFTEADGWGAVPITK